MKRDLACVLEGQSQHGGGGGESSRTTESESSRIYEKLESKRFKGAIVNGLIVYTRLRKSGINGQPKAKIIGESKGELTEVVVRDVGNSSLEIPKTRGKGAGSEPKSLAAVHDVDGELVEVVVTDESNCHVETGTIVKKSGGGSRDGRKSGRGGKRVGGGRRKSKVGSSSRRFTRSALTPSSETPLVAPTNVVPGKAEVVSMDEVVSDVEVEKTVEVSSLLSNSKLELKMSKKIVIDRKPTTVKELFDTGLVDGVTVIYMGSKKAFGLRGTIRNGGILCSCISCNGCRVIPPSQFEIHACKTYRRAAQYICLENGRSLLDLLKVCRNASLHSLETTIQKFISSSPIDKYFTCKKCSVSFPPYCAIEDGSLCYSCMDSNKSESIPFQETGESLGNLMPVSMSMSPKYVSSKTPQKTPKAKKNGISKTPKTVIPRSSKRAITKTPKCAISKSPKSAISKSPKSAVSKSPKSASVSMSLQDNSLWNNSLTPVSISSPSKSASLMHSEYKSGWKITSKSAKSVLISRSPSSASVYFSSQKKSQWRITTKDQRLHKLVFEDGGLPDGTEVAYYARGQKLLVGYKKGFGIFCRCCNSEVSPSQFEAHAGWATRRKPYAYIYTSNGVSLHELAISLSRGRKYSAKDNDDLCVICADGGNLVLCDGCPRAFHRDCASLTGVPRGDWYCKFCQNIFQRERFVEHNKNALAAGRVEGIDPIEQITQRCLRIVKDIEAELTGCVLCRGYDFSKSGFGPRTIILCDQCEKEYHVGCLKKHKMANLKELPKGKWFCCTECNKIQSILQKCLSRGAEKLPESHLDIMKKKQEGNAAETVNDLDVSWRIISGKLASQESRSLLSKAVAIFHDCFDPIIDAESGRDLIPAMVYGRNVRSQEFGGMFCAVLMVNSTVVTAAIVRVFGQELAELPLVATSDGNHGKGYFQLLFSCIEKLLSFLGVKNLLLPAAPEAESIWTTKFGFSKIDPDQLANYRRTCYQMIHFKGTSMLHKIVPQYRLVNTAG